MEEKKETVFIWPVRIYFEDTDTGGIVFYANYLKFFERARSEWLRHLGIGQQVLAQTEELMFVVKNTSIDYHAAAKLDDELAISVTVEKIGGASVHFAQQAWRINKGEPVLICSGKVLVACVDTYSLRPKAMPQPLHAKLVNGLNAN